MADAGTVFANLAGKAGLALTIIYWVVIGLILLVGIGGLIFWRIRAKRYIYKAEIWGSDGGIPDVLIVDKARPVKIRTKEGISSLLFLKKLKRYIKMPSRDFFKNNRVRFWFRKDGELTPMRVKKPLIAKLLEAKPFSKDGEFKTLNEQELQQLENDKALFVPYVLEDVNKRFECSNVEFINEDMRLSHVSTGKIIREMFNIEKWLKEHGHTILLILGIIVMAISIILILDGSKDYYASANSVSEGTEKFLKRFDQSNELAIQTIEELRSLRKELNNPSPAPSPPPVVQTEVNSSQPPNE